MRVWRMSSCSPWRRSPRFRWRGNWLESCSHDSRRVRHREVRRASHGPHTSSTLQAYSKATAINTDGITRQSGVRLRTCSYSL